MNRTSHGEGIDRVPLLEFPTISRESRIVDRCLQNADNRNTSAVIRDLSGLIHSWQVQLIISRLLSLPPC